MIEILNATKNNLPYFIDLLIVLAVLEKSYFKNVEVLQSTWWKEKIEEADNKVLNLSMSIMKTLVSKTLATERIQF